MLSAHMNAFIAAMSLAVAACASRVPQAATPIPVAATSRDVTTDTALVLAVENQWGDALNKRDMVALDRILAADHSVITKDGSVLTKAQEMANYQSGGSSGELFDFEPMNVRLFGDTAIVTGGHRERSQFHGKDTSGRYRWTDVFVMREHRWQAVASQLTRVDEHTP